MPPTKVPEAGTQSASAYDVDLFQGHRNRHFLASAGKISRIAMVTSIVAHLIYFATFVHADYPAWRIAVAASSVGLFMLSQIRVIRRLRVAEQVEQAFACITSRALLFIGVSVAVTGGLHSPAASSLIMPSMISLMFFGPLVLSRPVAWVGPLVIVGLAFVPSVVTGPHLGDTHYAIALMTILLLNLNALQIILRQSLAASYAANADMAAERTERVEVAEAQTRRLQKVAANVAHELKNPLAAIKGLTQLVARAEQHERTPERMAVVLSEIARMEQILGEYLSFSRPLEDLRKQPVELGALLRDVALVLAGRVENAGVSLNLDLVPTSIEGDPRRLKEALLNVVSNAIEATPVGGTIKLAVQPVVNASRRGATVTIADTGRGIAAEDLPKIGTSFFTTRADGTGLGVVLASAAIAQHGGTLRFDSVQGKGTTVTIELPATPAAATAAAAAAAPATATAPATAPATATAPAIASAS